MKNILRSARLQDLSFENLKIREKIILTILPIIFLSLVITSFASYFILSIKARDTAGEKIAIIGSTTAAQLLVKVDGYVRSLETLAISPLIISATESANQAADDLAAGREAEIIRLDQAWVQQDAAALPLVQSILDQPTSQYFQRYKQLSPEEVELILTDRRGVNIAMSTRTSDYLQADEEWWKATYAGGAGRLFVGSPIYDESTKTWAIQISAPVRAPDTRQVTGVLRRTINITSIIESISGITIAETGYASLLDLDGKIYHTRDPRLNLTPAPVSITQWVQSGGAGWRYDLPDLNGNPALVSLTPLKGEHIGNLDLVLLLSQEKSEVDGTIFNTLIGQLILSALLSLGLGILCVLLANHIGESLFGLEKMAADLSISSAHLGFDPTIQSKILRRRDEVGELARAFYQMALHLRASYLSLQESEKRFRALSENMLAGVFVMIGRQVVYANPALNQMTGEAPGSLTGATLRDWVAADDLERIQKELADCQSGEIEILHTECRCIQRGGGLMPVEMLVTPLMYDGQPALLGTLLDITDRKLAEEEMLLFNARLEQSVHERTSELEMANDELEAFCYSVSHDLNAPLRRMNNFSQILLEEHTDQMDETAKDYLNRICAATQSMEQLIRDLLRLSRVGRSEMQLEPVDLSELARKVLADLSSAEPERNFVCQIPEALPVVADTRLIQIALENLIGNAWKYSAKNQQTLIELGLETRDGERVYFVRDHGIGFDMDAAQRLFEPFQRLDSARDYSGTGIGLTVVKRIILRHGGKIWAEARPNEGATFYFTLTEG